MNQPAVDIVNKYLLDMSKSNAAQGIWPGNAVVIHRLLGDPDNLRDAWCDLLKQFPPGQKALGRTCDKWQMVVEAIVEVAAGWSPGKVSDTRQAIRDVSAMTVEIQEKALELAALMRHRSRLCEKNAIRKEPMDFHPVNLLEPAARIADSNGSIYGDTHYRFANHLDAPLRSLAGQFDLKYWPTTADVVEAIAEFQNSANLSLDTLSESATEVRQASKRDFNRALDAALEDLNTFDVEVKLSNGSYAAIVDAALGLDQTESEESIKKYRADERKRKG